LERLTVEVVIAVQSERSYDVGYFDDASVDVNSLSTTHPGLQNSSRKRWREAVVLATKALALLGLK
jgi:hypothetical protein